MSARPAVVIGATGATGRNVVKALLASDKWSEVIVVVRAPRPELFAEDTPKLKVQVVPDQLGGMEAAAAAWPSGATLFNTIGTTRSAAGGAAGFKEVEVGITTAAVTAAAGAGVTHVSCVSAQGARNGWVDPWEAIHPLLYARTLWQKEQACLSAGIPRVSIFQPGMLNRLTGDRAVENVINYLGLGLRVDLLAQAMVKDAEAEAAAGEDPRYVTGNSAITAAALASEGPRASI